ncbi:MAG: S24/S26 family peptidase [Myxococcales bacterium]|nr:S24/S26 family peptidase [Myxococcales bacterium]MBP6846528.1 S24/S26 family peptidase [Kofleriaceae bacterium]
MTPRLDLPPSVRARIELLRERAQGGLTVTCGGVSMEPVIRRGDAVRVRAGRPRVGEVAAFVTRGGQLELHRLVARAPGLGWWVHAGDNQVAPALGLVHDAQLIGVADVARGPVALTQRLRAAVRLARAGLRLGLARARQR